LEAGRGPEPRYGAPPFSRKGQARNPSGSQTREPKTIGDYFEEHGKLEAIASGRLALPEPKE